MKSNRLFRLLPLLCAASASATDIHFMAWNLEWFPGRAPTPKEEVIEPQKKAVAEVLAREKPDIFVGEEVRNWQAFADAASAVPGLRTVVVSPFRGEDGTLWPQQIGIASQLPVESTWAEAWKHVESTPPRGFSFAAVSLPAPETGVLLVYGVHLKSNRGGDPKVDAVNFKMREESAAQLLAHVNEMENAVFAGRVRGIIVAGDFNTNQDGQFGDKTLEILTKGGFHNTWEGVEKKDRLTWRGSDRYEPTTFDYILTKGLPTGTAKMVPADTAASDHWPVMITISLP